MAVNISIEIKQNSQNLANNTSNVTVSVEALWTQGSWNATGKCTGELIIDGVSYDFAGIVFNSGQTQTGSQTIMTQTATITHAADGSKKLNCSASFVTGVSSGTVTASASKTLTTIPRATTPEVSASVLNMGERLTISLPRAATSFTHDLAYRLNDGAYVNIATGVATSYTWTVPDLANSLPNDPDGVITIRCITKSGSTSVGTKVVAFTARVPATVVPTISSVNVTDETPNLTAVFGAFIQSKSALSVAITASGAKGSTIKSYKTVFLDDTYTTASFSTGVVFSSGALTMVTEVTDSRGRTAKVTTNLMVLPYAPPQIQKLNVYRATEDAEPADDGAYMVLEYAYSVSTLMNKQTALAEFRYKRSADEDYVEPPFLTDSVSATSGSVVVFRDFTFSPDYTYDVQMTVTDYFGAETPTLAQLPSGKVILDISADGLGLGIGVTAQRPGLEVGWEARMSGGFDALVLRANTDLNTRLTPNTYAGGAYQGYLNCPATDRDFTLEVLPAGTSGQLMQRLTTRVPLAPVVYGRFYEGGAWTSWSIIGFESIWQGATLSADFALYASDQSVQYRRSGGVVELKGVVKPTRKIEYAEGWVTITTLPQGYRPGGLVEVNRVCQGGGTCIWLLRITTAGAVQLARYRDGSTTTVVDTADRLPFSVIFLADR